MMALTQSIPTGDISPSVDSKEMISPDFNAEENFIIPFKPVNDLTDDETVNYDIMSQSTSAIVVNLKIENDGFIVNGLPLELETTSVQVIEAKVIPANLRKEEVDNYNDNHDIALVTVKISSSVNSIPANVKGLTINRIMISITAMEVDGEEIVQVEAIEKILEIEQVTEFPSSFLFDESDDYHYQRHHHRHHHHSCKNRFSRLKAHARHWWRCSSKSTRIVLTSLLLTLTFGVFFAIYHSISTFYQKYFSTTDSYHRIPNNFYNDENLLVEKVIFINDEEKRALMEEYNN